MKNTLYFIFIVVACNSQQQAHYNKKSCNNKHLLPSVEEVEINNSIKVIHISELNALSQNLISKIRKGIKLSMKEDIQTVQIANTVLWAEYDGVTDQINKCPHALELYILFKEDYLCKIWDKYTLSTGRGMAINFKELKIQYSGNPASNSRFKIING